jgi:hypothetical protein
MLKRYLNFPARYALDCFGGMQRLPSRSIRKTPTRKRGNHWSPGNVWINDELQHANAIKINDFENAITPNFRKLSF